MLRALLQSWKSDKLMGSSRATNIAIAILENATFWYGTKNYLVFSGYQ